MHFVDGMGRGGLSGWGTEKKKCTRLLLPPSPYRERHSRLYGYRLKLFFFSLPLSSQVVYVMPSTSGRTQTYPRASDKLPFFLELKSLRDELKANSVHHSSSEEEVQSSVNET